MTPSKRSDDLAAWESWLGDRRKTAEAGTLARDLDDLYAAGPKPAAWERARQALTTGLRERAPLPVSYTRVVRSPVGPLWVAVSEKGLVAVEYDRPEAAFQRDLERRLRRPVVRAEGPTEEARRQVFEYLNGRRRSFSLSIDLRHLTAFQRRVLEAAQAVPRGQVATYGQIARRIGRPRAARAVGQALGSNPVPIVIPCHRVLASDGRLGGYSGRGGLRTKEKLLRLEGAMM
jgi:methylated-DNA-[protein]-cysteine S-methyltransferase